MVVNNRLIAEFMELETTVFKSGIINYYHKEYNSGTWYEAHELSYNKSWDWLMPVIHKIITGVSISDPFYYKLKESLWELDIQNLYNVVIEYIKTKNPINYYFNLPIGDWSEDGHSHCTYFLIKSNVSIGDIVESYFKAHDKWKIGDLCSDYGEDSISENTLTTLIDAGFIRNKMVMDDDEVDSDKYYPDAEGLAYIILKSIMLINPAIKLEICNKPTYPSFNNWLDDKYLKKRYLKLPGYGLFE